MFFSLSFVDHGSVASLSLCGAPQGPIPPSLILFASCVCSSNHVLICPLDRMLLTITELSSGRSDHVNVVLRIRLYMGNLPDALAKTSGVIELDPTPRATAAAGEIGVELDVQIVVLGGDD